MATSDEVLTDVLLLCGWPALADNPPLGSADLLLLCDHVIKGSMWPDILAAQGDYYLDYVDHAITNGIARYRLPAKAYGPIKDVLFIDTGATEDEHESVDFMNVEELGYGRERRNRSRYLAFIDGDFLGLSPVPTTTSGTIRIRYYRAPSKLTLFANAATITTFTPGGGVAGADRFVHTPDKSGTWTSSDFIDAISAGNAHQVIDANMDVVGGVAGAIDVAAGTASTLIAAGDYIMLTGYTPVVQVPESMLPLLVQSVALLALHHEGDKEGFARVAGLANASAKKALGTLDPRSEAEPRKIVPRDTPLRIASGGRYRGW